MAGGPYNIPRNTKGEGRILYIFSKKAFGTTAIFAIAGFFITIPIAIVVGTMLVSGLGAVIVGFIGFCISSFKIPDSQAFEVTRKAGGEYIIDIIKRYIKFKMKKNKIYLYFMEGKNDE